MSDLDRLVRRLRGPAARRLAADLAAIGGEGHTLPAVPDHALPHVLAVVGADARAVDPEATAMVIAAALEANR